MGVIGLLAESKLHVLWVRTKVPRLYISNLALKSLCRWKIVAVESQNCGFSSLMQAEAATPKHPQEGYLIFGGVSKRKAIDNGIRGSYKNNVDLCTKIDLYHAGIQLSSATNAGQVSGSDLVDCSFE